MGMKARKRGTDEYVVVSFSARRGRTWGVTIGPRSIWTGVRLKYIAVDRGRKIARAEKRELVIKSKSGRIERRESYGNDPAHRPG